MNGADKVNPTVPAHRVEPVGHFPENIISNHRENGKIVEEGRHPGKG
jgi:hypothetical protein